MSFEEIANETFIDIDTLKYYNVQYNKTALGYVREESRIDRDYGIVLKEYGKSGL